MCGRFEVLTYEEVAAVVAAVERRADAKTRVRPDDSRAQARPGDQLVLFGRNSASGDLEIAEASWGFEAGFSNSTVFNTRIESALAGSPLWRGPIENGRCIIPAAAFYEPHASEMVRSPKTGRPIKRQYRFAAADDEPLLLAGVQEGGRCSIVTCEPNRWVAPVHGRMPLALRFEEVRTWLSPDWPSLADRSQFELLARPEHPDLPVQSGGADAPDQLSLF